MRKLFSRFLAPLTLLALTACGSAESQKQAEAGDNLPAMLAGDWVPEDPHQIDFANLPKLEKSEHIIVNDVRDQDGHRVNQHNYLIHHNGQFWIMWSDGPGVPRAEPGQHRDKTPGHDRAGQVVAYSTSKDGVNWAPAKRLTDSLTGDWGWIARGFWLRDGQMLALATIYNAPGYPGEGLALHAFVFDETKGEWKNHGVVYDNAMNNFPPAKLPSGEWMMTRRDSVQNVSFMYGGVEGFDKWNSVPVSEYNKKAEFRPEEPYWWVLPDNKTILALFRDNSKSGFLYRATSIDNGRTWTKPVKTNFPDATSKFSGVRLKDGRYILVSNPNPKKRDPMTISVSDDGITFNKMVYLDGGRGIDYPHVMVHEGYLYIAYASAKQTVEIMRVSIEELDKVQMPSNPITVNP